VTVKLAADGGALMQADVDVAPCLDIGVHFGHHSLDLRPVPIG
jgi:hypothetical protein